MAIRLRFGKTLAAFCFAWPTAALAWDCPAPSGADKEAGYWTPIGTFDEQKDATDFSGIDCISERECVLVSDEKRTLFPVVLDRGANTMTIVEGEKLKRRDALNDEKRELDLEAVAAVEGDYVVVGSHALRRKSDFAAQDPYQPTRFAIYRLPDDEPQTALDAALPQHPALDDFYRRALTYNGLNVEGLGYRNGELFVGFRAPVWTGEVLSQSENFDQAYILQIDAKVAGGQDAGPGTLHAVTLSNGEGIRAIDEVQDGLLLLTGPAAPDPTEPINIDRGTGLGGVYAIPTNQPYRVMRWAPGEGTAIELAVLDPRAEEKPEGLVVLEETADAVKVLVIHDTGLCGSPRQIVIPMAH